MLIAVTAVAREPVLARDAETAIRVIRARLA